MGKVVKFHNAEMLVTALVIDGEKSEGVRQLRVALFLNTDAEFTAAREQIDDFLQQLQDEVNGTGNSGN